MKAKPEPVAPMLLEEMHKEIESLKAQRDELLAACEALLPITATLWDTLSYLPGDFEIPDEIDAVVEQTQAAIAKAHDDN